MTPPDDRDVLGIIGGTGPQGRGLAARWALAGYEVHIGSRSRERAQAAVDDVRQRLGRDTGARLGRDTGARLGRDVPVHAASNDEAAAAAQIVVVSVPYDAQPTLLPPLRDAVGSKVVCNIVNPMVFDEAGPRAVRIEAGSAAEECQEIWPDARVVSAFHDVSSRRLLKAHEPITTHVLICSDDVDAAHRVAHLASRVEGMWGVYAGPLRMSEYIENLTPVILFINGYYRIQAGLLIDGIEHDEEALHAHRAEGDVRAGRKPRG